MEVFTDWIWVPIVVTLICLICIGSTKEEPHPFEQFGEMAYWFEILCWALVMTIAWLIWALLKLNEVI